MSSTKRRLKAGDWVQVLSKLEILATLDEHGKVDGTLFMPEMFAFCGRTFQVYKRAHKTCDTVFPVRSRRVANAVHLETRCNGQAHGRCEAGCLLFWNEAWLKRVAPHTPNVNEGDPLYSADAIRPANATKSEFVVWAQTEAVDNDASRPRYSCQATMLPYATTDLKWWDIRQYIEDFTSGNVGLWRIFKGFIYSLYYNLSQSGLGLGQPMRWIYNRFHPLWRGTLFPRLPGRIPAGHPTPTETLNLQPGELVQVKSHAEILETVTTENKNRGMSWDAELVPYCGKQFRVLRRVERLIDERTGYMQEMKSPAVILDSVVCQSRYSDCRMFCPRSIYPYWREIWLRRTGPAPLDGPSDTHQEAVCSQVQ
jgi:hypothetical protein